MTTKISGSLPSDDSNGMHVIAKALVNRPKDTHVIVAVISTKTLTTDVATGAVQPTAEIRAVEVVDPSTAVDDLEVAQRLMRRASERRHGGEMLPIDVEDQFTRLFETVEREHLEERIEAEEAAIAAAEAALRDVEGDEPADPEGDVDEDADAAALAAHEGDWDDDEPVVPLDVVDDRTDDEKRADGDDERPDHGPQFSG